MTEQVAEEVFRTARDTIEVPPPPYDAVVGRSRDLRRSGAGGSSAGVAAGALVVAGLAWVSTRPAPGAGGRPRTSSRRGTRSTWPGTAAAGST